jgi:hypothetical protein
VRKRRFPPLLSVPFHQINDGFSPVFLLIEQEMILRSALLNRFTIPMILPAVIEPAVQLRCLKKCAGVTQKVTVNT